MGQPLDLTEDVQQQLAVLVTQAAGAQRELNLYFNGLCAGLGVNPTDYQIQADGSVILKDEA